MFTRDVTTHNIATGVEVQGDFVSLYGVPTSLNLPASVQILNQADGTIFTTQASPVDPSDASPHAGRQRTKYAQNNTTVFG